MTTTQTTKKPRRSASKTSSTKSRKGAVKPRLASRPASRPASLQPRHPYQQQLRDFLRFLPANLDLRKDPQAGRILLEHYGAIYWPAFTAKMRRSTVWLDRFWSEEQRLQERTAKAIPSRGPVYDAWFTKALRRHVDALLGPLVIPTDTPVGADCVVYAYTLRGYGEDRLPDHTFPPGEWEALTDPKNYTFFKRVRLSDKSLRRILAVPPPLEDMQSHLPSLPPEIVALYWAWRALSRRHIAPYDPERTGVEFTASGYVFVNWDRFIPSSQGVTLPVRITAAECARTLVGGYHHGTIKLKMAAIPSPRSDDTIPAATRAINHDDFVMNTDACSVFDPAYLADRWERFDVAYHAKRVAQQEAKKQERVERLGGALKKKREAKLYIFAFRPFDLVPREFATYTKPTWFALSHIENVYAVSYRKELYFLQPELLAHTPDNERDAWFRAMDQLSCVAQFSKTGDITKVVNKSRSEQMKHIQAEEWAVTARRAIADFVSLDALTAKQMAKVKRETTMRMGRDPESNTVGERWYHDRMLQLAKDSLPLSAVRRQVHAKIPDRNNGEPTDHVFYSIRAVKRFLLESSKEPQAPYLHAWAAFCVKMYNQGPVMVKERWHNRHWTPEDDAKLLAGYRKHPRMSTLEKRNLLEQLGGGHDWSGVCRRARTVDNLLDHVLTANQRVKWPVNGRALDAQHPDADLRRLEIKRMLILIGIVTHRKAMQEPLMRGLPVARRVLEATYRELERATLPAIYRTHVFERLFEVV